MGKIIKAKNISEINTQKLVENASILYVEDDAITRSNLSKYLKTQCKVLYTADNGHQGLELFKKYKPEIVITDIRMPLLNGLDMAKKIREISLSTQIIIITAYQKPQYLLEAVNLQLVQYLLKPINLKKIDTALVLSSKYLNKSLGNTRCCISKGVFYDGYTKELVSLNNIVPLSKYERALLELLITKYPAPVSYNHINAEIYDYGASQNALKMLVSSLRAKIKKESISNIPGFGYKLSSIDEV